MPAAHLHGLPELGLLCSLELLQLQLLCSLLQGVQARLDGLLLLLLLLLLHRPDSSRTRPLVVGLCLPSQWGLLGLLGFLLLPLLGLVLLLLVALPVTQVLQHLCPWHGLRRGGLLNVQQGMDEATRDLQSKRRLSKSCVCPSSCCCCWRSLALYCCFSLRSCSCKSISTCAQAAS